MGITNELRILSMASMLSWLESRSEMILKNMCTQMFLLRISTAKLNKPTV